MTLRRRTRGRRLHAQPRGRRDSVVVVRLVVQRGEAGRWCTAATGRCERGCSCTLSSSLGAPPVTTRTDAHLPSPHAHAPQSLYQPHLTLGVHLPSWCILDLWRLVWGGQWMRCWPSKRRLWRTPRVSQATGMAKTRAAATGPGWFATAATPPSSPCEWHPLLKPTYPLH